MTHLHIPDGVLPAWLWIAGLALAFVVTAGVSLHHRHDKGDRLTLLAALSAVMLAAMAVPLGPLGHLSFGPVVGILLGPGFGFLAAVIVNAILALFGHGGLTVVGLNACVTGVGVAAARPAFRLAALRLAPGPAAAVAAVLSAGVSLAALALVLVAAVPAGELAARSAALADGHAHGPDSAGRFLLYSSPFWLFGLAAEAVLTASVVAFLVRVRPELVPGEAA